MGAAALAGFGFGFLVAAQVGPIWLLCIRSTLRGRFVIGLAIGAGAAAIDTAYAALGVVGAASVLRALPQLRLALGLLGAGVLVGLGARTMWSALRIRQGMETPGEVSSLGRAFLTALVATASNPLTIASWAAIFTASSTAHIAAGTSGAIVFLVGVGAGSLAWFTVLSGLAIVARRRLGSGAIRWIDVASGLGLVGFGGLLGWRSVRSH
ncbi:MAG: LysE family transporter [Acidimicrobiales bacterium]